MSAEEVAVAALGNAAAVTALVGDRIKPDFVDVGDALPAISISRANTEPVTSIHGGAPLGAITTLEIWCMASTRAAAEDLADKVVTALSTFDVVNRTPEVDSEAVVYATVLTVHFYE